MLFGILDALATRLASFVIASNAISMSRMNLGGSNRTEILPATSRARLAPILQAISTIITNSAARANKFLCASVFNAIFPRETDSYHGRTSAGKKPRTRLPENNHPPLNNFATLGKRSGKGYSSALETTATEGSSASSEDEEMPLVAWLIEVIRAQTGLVRLMSAWVLAILYRSGLACQGREKGLSMLLIPVLVQMLDGTYTSLDDDNPSYDMSALQIPAWLILQNAPHVLALLLAECPDLQKAAHDAGIIKKLSQLLKQSYDPVSAASTATMWSPNATGLPEIPNRDIGSVSKLGPPGLQPIIFHTLQVRESVLMALHAMAALEDEYRKAIMDNGVVPFVVESLKPYERGAEIDMFTTEKSRNEFHKIGNPIPVIIAACAAAKSLSRSVGALRTILVDANLADPIYKLLTHPDAEVQVASTSAACNIVLEFSAMREVCYRAIFLLSSMPLTSSFQPFINAGGLKILCEHAHSLNAKLRLNAVWALKHLVHTAPNSLKISCVQELGPGWLKQIICNDTDEQFSQRYSGDRGGTPIAMGTPNAAGEQVDLLNAMDEGPQHSSPTQEVDEDDEVNMIDSVGPLSRSDSRRRYSRSMNPDNKLASLERQRLANLYDDEAQMAAQARHDDLAVQEQGLDLVRNLICGPDSPEMVDYLFKEFGQDKFFDMLGKLLRPKVINAFNRDRRFTGADVKHIQPPKEIIVAVCYILVHLAGSQSRHRQLLISQSELLKLMVPLLTHVDAEVRVCCVWTIINLIWTDDHSDKLHCKSRAFELRKLGVLEKLRELESDAELDVRERTKMAMVQMNELLR